MIEMDCSKAGVLDKTSEKYCKESIKAFENDYPSSEKRKALVKRVGPSEFHIQIVDLKNNIIKTIYANSDMFSKFNR